MAGHSQFKNIMHRKGAQDAKKAKIFTKLIREIIVSVKTGQPDPQFNSRLRNAIIAAKKASMPKDKIDSAIKKGSSAAEGDNYEEVRYEGYAPGGVAVIVDALTDNRNRTASEVRAAFTKFGGSLGEMGSVSFMFERVGYIEYPKAVASEEEMFEAALELGAEDCQSNENAHEIYTDAAKLNEVREGLAKKFGEAEEVKLTWKPLNTIPIDQEKAPAIMKMIEMLEDSDDVQAVTANFDMTEEVMEALGFGPKSQV